MIFAMMYRRCRLSYLVARQTLTTYLQIVWKSVQYMHVSRLLQMSIHRVLYWHFVTILRTRSERLL